MRDAWEKSGRYVLYPTVIIYALFFTYALHQASKETLAAADASRRIDDLNSFSNAAWIRTVEISNQWAADSNQWSNKLYDAINPAFAIKAWIFQVTFAGHKDNEDQELILWGRIDNYGRPVRLELGPVEMTLPDGTKSFGQKVVTKPLINLQRGNEVMSLYYDDSLAAKLSTPIQKEDFRSGFIEVSFPTIKTVNDLISKSNAVFKVEVRDFSGRYRTVMTSTKSLQWSQDIHVDH